MQTPYKNIRIESRDHKVLKIIGAYTGLSNKDLFAQAMPLLAGRYTELLSHYPSDYEVILEKAGGSNA